MPFCPSCRAEFEAGVSQCADCGVNLVDQLDTSSTAEELSDVYVCYDAQQADRLGDLLKEKAIPHLIRDRSSSSFPTTVGKTAQRIVAVPSDQRNYALSVIEGAVHDGVLSADGEIISS